MKHGQNRTEINPFKILNRKLEFKIAYSELITYDHVGHIYT